MKTLRRIKLNSLSQEDLADREMNMLRGGSNCSCGCMGAVSYTHLTLPTILRV